MNAPERLQPLGLVRDMPAAQYHAIRAMSASGLKLLKQSPAHYFGRYMDPARPPDLPSAAMANGTLVHCALFEPDQVAARYVVKPAGLKLTTKDGIAWKEAQTLQVVSAEDMAAAMAQAAAVRADPDVGALLSDGYGEASAFWVDEQTGELCKCRPDFVSPAGDGVILTDGKTCRDASPKGFQRAAVNLSYDLSAAWYTDGFEKATGLRVYGYVFACVESDWPHPAAAYMLDDVWLQRAREKNRELLDAYAACKAANKWPGYPSGINLLEAPAWAL